ncbi:DDB1- and CUL4-associated factor 5-like [Babylonia areolata]|uniref:DDB1- and CUL4-associated factor 5-like n=1 Tax=Babylonia areolata TaxID=304850 RepID=UPI003FD1499A
MASNNEKTKRCYTMHNPLCFLTKRAENFGWASPYVLMKERFAKAQSLYRRDLKAHYGCVNAIEFSNDGSYIVSGGDDRRVLLWNVEKALSDIGEPVPMKGEHNSNIFCLAINKSNTKIYSGGNDEQVVLHDIESGETEDVFRHDEAVYGLSTDPNNETIFASACDDGRVLVYDTREPASSDPFVLAVYTSSMHAVMYNPAEPRLLATANAKEGVGLWDIRKPRSCLMRYGGRYLQQSCMSVRINNRGTHLVALRRRLPPVLYELGSTNPLCDLDHDGYYNSCTMKSCSFAGPNDEYVLSGSDDFNLYMWKIPDDLSQRVYMKEAHMILHGHRSIVNQVRYNHQNGIIISSGVEKIIKVWSPFPLQKGSGGIDSDSEEAFTERPVYTHEEYINLVLRSGLVMSHDYSSQSVEEDPRMMAFFDSLVQRELEYWSSEEDLSSNEIELYDSILQVTRRAQQTVADGHDSESAQHDADGHVSDSSDEFSPFTLAFASVMAAQETDASRVLDAHDESERVRGSGQDLLELGSGSSTRRRNRKSISEIIAQNRKEVMRAAEMRHRNMRSSVTLHPNILSSSSSESDSDDQAERSSVKVEDVSHLLRSRSSQQQRTVNRLKRLQALRTRLVTSDTDNSGEDDSPQHKRARKASNSSKEEAQSVLNDHCDGGKAVSNDKATHHVKSSDCGASTSHAVSYHLSSVPKGKTGFEHEAGPYLQQSDGPGHSGHLPSLPSSNSSAHPEPTASTSGASAAPPEDKTASADDQNSGTAVNRESSCETYGSEPVQDSDGDSSQPVWNEFTKFKKRLKRASRYFRKRMQANNDSSDED